MPVPIQHHFRAAHTYLNVPECFRLEVCDFVVSLHAEAERRRLTRSVRYQRRVQITIVSLEESRLKASKCAANAQIDLLTSINTFGFILVRSNQIGHRVLNILLGDGWEFRPVCYILRLYISNGPRDGVHHFEANVFALFVAIQPQHKVIASFWLLGQKWWHP